MPVHIMEIEELLQAKETMHVKVQDQNNMKGVFHFEFVPERTTVSETFYMKFERLVDAVRHKRREFRKDCSLILHDDNALAHTLS
jgi:hypothetical protein